jgi:hypothetical protein
LSKWRKELNSSPSKRKSARKSSANSKKVVISASPSRTVEKTAPSKNVKKNRFPADQGLREVEQLKNQVKRLKEKLKEAKGIIKAQNKYCFEAQKKLFDLVLVSDSIISEDD